MHHHCRLVDIGRQRVRVPTSIRSIAETTRIRQHTFVLADNRHYAFYLNQRIFQRVPTTYIGAGFCLSAMGILGKLLKLDSTDFLLYSLATFTTLIPTSLLEFRYYLIPWSIWRLRQAESDMTERGKLMEVLWWLLLHYTTTYMFIFRTFHWPDTTSVQRFMW